MEITLFTTPTCQRCKALKNLLEKRKIEYNEIDITNGPEELAAHSYYANTNQLPLVKIEDFVFEGPDEITEALKKIQSLKEVT